MEWAKTNGEISACYEVMRELRPHLASHEFLEKVQLQQKSGYQLVFKSAENEVVSVAGFRILRNLAWGKILYIDDLVTRSADRSRGYGAALLSEITDYARQQGCDELHLDSGVQRTGAHKFYKNQGMDLSSYHFKLNLK